MTIEIKMNENDVLNINGVNFTFYNGSFVEVKNKNIVFPACFGLQGYRTCEVDCIYKLKCGDICDQMERFAKHVPSGYVKLKPAEPIPDCFGIRPNDVVHSSKKGISVCYNCTYSTTCMKAYELWSESPKKEIPKTPLCFGTEVESGCKNCSYINPCKKAYSKIEETRKNFKIKVIKDMQKGFNDVITKVADTVSKNMKDPLESITKGKEDFVSPHRG